MTHTGCRPRRVDAGHLRAAAGDALKQAQTLAGYAKHIKASTEATNHVAYGTLLLMARVGELCPNRQGARADLTSPGTPEKLFNKNTLTDYRKVTRHQENARVDEYFQTIADEGHKDAMSLAAEPGLRTRIGVGQFAPSLKAKTDMKVERNGRTSRYVFSRGENVLNAMDPGRLLRRTG